MVDSWTESMTARERVETIATTLEKPRTTNWIADQAEVQWDTAKTHLESLAETGSLIVTESGEYVPDPTDAYFDLIKETILENDKEALRGELESIARRTSGWKDEYGVDSIDALESTLADDLDVTEVQERRRVIRRWENSMRTRETIRAAMVLYDDVRLLTDEVRSSHAIEEAG